MSSEANDPELAKREPLPSVHLDAIDGDSKREGSVLSYKKSALCKKYWKAVFGAAESSGISPVPPEQRLDTSGRSLFTLWFAANCTLLPITTGLSGPLIFGLSLKVSSLCILSTTLAAFAPVAWMSTMGPKTGLRQIIQTRFYFGRHLTLIIAILQLATLAGYTMLTSIVGGQTLAAVAGGSVSTTVGIVITVIGALPVSFMGYKFLHVFEAYCWIPSLIALIVTVGISGHLLFDQADLEPPTPRAVVSFMSLCSSLSVSWAGFVSDFSVYISSEVPRHRVFGYVYIGYCLPSIPLLILGAAIGGATPNVQSWTEANDAFSTGGLLYALVAPAGRFGKFVAVILALSVIGINACSLYSLSISAQSIHEWFIRVPRYIFTLVVSAIIIGVAIPAATNFYASLSNLLAVIGYWTSVYVGIALADIMLFRKGKYQDYDISIWNMRNELPIELAATGSLMLSFGVIIPCMDAAWYTGPLAQHTGDLGVWTGMLLSPIFYMLLRPVEKRFFKR